jgi:hypothetical protein
MTINISDPGQGFSLCVSHQDNPRQNHSGIWKPEVNAAADLQLAYSLKSLYAPEGPQADDETSDLSPDITVTKPVLIRY